MMLPKYAFLNIPEFPGIEFILNTNPPFNVFRVYQFHSKEDAKKFTLKHVLFGGFTPIEGYNIMLPFVGTLTEFTLIPADTSRVSIIIENDMQYLKQWYFEKRIKGNETRMKKYKAL